MAKVRTKSLILRFPLAIATKPNLAKVFVAWVRVCPITTIFTGPFKISAALLQSDQFSLEPHRSLSGVLSALSSSVQSSQFARNSHVAKSDQSLAVFRAHRNSRELVRCVGERTNIAAKTAYATGFVGMITIFLVPCSQRSSHLSRYTPCIAYLPAHRQFSQSLVFG